MTSNTSHYLLSLLMSITSSRFQMTSHKKRIKHHVSLCLFPVLDSRNDVEFGALFLLLSYHSAVALPVAFCFLVKHSKCNCAWTCGQKWRSDLRVRMYPSLNVSKPNGITNARRRRQCNCCLKSVVLEPRPGRSQEQISSWTVGH